MKKVLVIYSLVLSLISFAQLDKSWEGVYVGDLHSENLKGSHVSYHMELHIKALNETTYEWIIVYGQDSLKQERNYQLIHKEGNSFVLDEQNSILIPMSLHKNSLHSVFEVQGNLLHVVYTLGKEEITFELMSAGKKTTSGGETDAQDQPIPIVNSYKPSAFQTAQLKRQ